MSTCFAGTVTAFVNLLSDCSGRCLRWWDRAANSIPKKIGASGPQSVRGTCAPHEQTPPAQAIVSSCLMILCEIKDKFANFLVMDEVPVHLRSFVTRPVRCRLYQRRTEHKAGTCTFFPTPREWAVTIVFRLWITQECVSLSWVVVLAANFACPVSTFLIQPSLHFPNNQLLLSLDHVSELDWRVQHPSMEITREGGERGW